MKKTEYTDFVSLIWKSSTVLANIQDKCEKMWTHFTREKKKNTLFVHKSHCSVEDTKL